MRNLIFLIGALSLCSCNNEKSGSQGANFTENVNKVAVDIIDDSDQLGFFEQPTARMEAKYQAFPTGSVKPKGWILEMMTQDLETGIVGALDELYPGIHSDDLYYTARRGGMEDISEMGDLVLTGAAWEKSIMWWNAETIGNWWDGFIRHAFLTNDEKSIQQSEDIVNNLLASQDADGYIGIYKPNLRYQHDGSNGELWAQTTAFRALLAYYEFTNDDRILPAVEKAMAVTMANYGEEGKNPFFLKNAFGGVTHGLMMTDVCETLYRITGNIVYEDYATYLYKAFSTYSVNRSFNDLRYPYLIEKDSAFEGHGVHTYEHIRSLVQAYYHTGYPELKQAYDNMLAKLEPCILPSGAGHGNEWIAKLEAHPDFTSSEYCTMLELRNSYGSLIQKTGDIAFADAAEKLTYNAMLGFRNEEGTAITYGKSDNCYVIDGKHHEHGESREDPRYKYSPTHSEPAVCCVPNYGRNFTYFLEQMWMKTQDGIAVAMYGPSALNTEVNGVKVSIEQVTDYPLSDDVVFQFEMDAAVVFTLYLRKPSWSARITPSIPATLQKDGYYRITKAWQPNETLTMRFENEIQFETALNGESYLQRGPIVFAYEIPHREEVIKAYENTAYKDYYCFPENEDYKDLSLKENANFTLVAAKEKTSFYEMNWSLAGEFFNRKTGQPLPLTLVPMGKTILRQVTFEQQ
jgi:DUF1680 family protein